MRNTTWFVVLVNAVLFSPSRAPRRRTPSDRGPPNSFRQKSRPKKRFRSASMPPKPRRSGSPAVTFPEWGGESR